MSSAAHWTPLDYVDVVPGSGAPKLADSQVAPLVAQARGYTGVLEATQVKDVVATSRVAEPTKVGNRLKRMLVGGEDFMVIPWFRVDRVFENGHAVVASSTQVRPSEPLPNRDGKAAKYEMLSGTGSPIDLHPAVTLGWTEHSSQWIITEGVLKADAALTAQLTAAGVSPSDLMARRGFDTAQARAELARLLEKVPPARRVPILAIVGVGNWHQNTEWNVLSLKDREVLIAFDGDLRKNVNVWNQAEKSWRFLTESKHATPRLLDLGGVDAETQKAAAGLPADAKLGIDDYLAKVGTWADLLTIVENELPPKPDVARGSNEPRIGEARIDEDGARVIVYEKIETLSGGTRTEWREVFPMGARVVEVSSSRILHDVSVRDGRISDATVSDSVEGHCVIEVAWHEDVEGELVIRRGKVTGPTTLLETAPVDWTRKGGNVHNDIKMQPSWPPRGKAGEQFLEAMKRHRIEDREVRVGWDTMGWVPTHSGHPAYVVGTQSLGRTQEDEQQNRPGVTEDEMPMATDYGVNDQYWDFVKAGDIEGWKAQFLQDFRTVVQHFIVDSPWSTPHIGPVAMLSALRPTCPGRTSLSLWVTGQARAGKSWMASFQMGFWQHKPGTWSVNHLPGQASDTFASREHSVARTPLFVVDDLAPSTSRVEAERQEAGVDQLVRSQFNGTGKRRSTATGGQRSVEHPRAVLVHTAENSREVQSIRDRLIEIRLSSEQIVSANGVALEALTRHPDNPMGRMTAALIRLWLNMDFSESTLPVEHGFSDDEVVDTWEFKLALFNRILEARRQMVVYLLADEYGIDSSRSTRRAGVIAELVATAAVIWEFAAMCGLTPEDPHWELMWPADGSAYGPVVGALIESAARDLNRLATYSPPLELMKAIGLLLESGKAHLAAPSLSGARPIEEGEHMDYLNFHAGWRFDQRAGQWLPQGTPIGFLGYSADGDLVAHITPSVAFKLAQEQHQSRLPSGNKAADVWRQVWLHDGGSLIAPDYREHDTKAAPNPRPRLHGGDKGATARAGRGIPLLFEKILGEDLRALGIGSDPDAARTPVEGDTTRLD